MRRKCVNVIERWKDIPEYEGLYRISNHGRIRSLGRFIQRKKYSYFRKGMYLKFGNSRGYLSVKLYRYNKQKQFKIHIIVLTSFDRSPKPGEQCNHKDGNKSNNYIENLEWVTCKENINHAIKVLGVSPIRNHKLIENQVKEIRVHLKEGKLIQKQIAEIYGVHKSVISNIKAGRVWKHLK